MIYRAIIEFTVEEESKTKKTKKELIIEDAVDCIDVIAQVTEYMEGTTIDWEVIEVKKYRSAEAIVRKGQK